MRRRQFLIMASGAASAGLLAKMGPASAQSLAGQQIRIIVPFPAGGPTDIVARPLGQMLGDALKAATSSSTIAPAPAVRSVLKPWPEPRPTAERC